MNAQLALRILCLGALMSPFFCPSTVGGDRPVQARSGAEAPDAQVAAGNRLWIRHTCNDCHTILALGSDYGPDLTSAYRRRGAEGIARAVRTPEQVTTWRSMPHLSLTGREVQDLVAFLRWTSAIDPGEWPPEGAREGWSEVAYELDGATLFKDKGCMECHRLNDTGGALGPDLSHVGDRLTRQTIDALLAHPRSINPRAVMPNPTLLPPERAELARFLAGHSSSKVATR